MLEARDENYEINPALYGGLRPWVQESSIHMAETVDFVGFVNEEPDKLRHPQDNNGVWLVRMSNFQNVPNGVYSVKIKKSDDGKSIRVFAGAAQLVTDIPNKTNDFYYPIWGENEVTLSEKAYNLTTPPKLIKKIGKCLRSAHAGFKYDFV
ncbi:MAG: hypothetical protein WC612_03975 [Bdellovibrionales bacterium]|jgi:hypothetical protein